MTRRRDWLKLIAASLACLILVALAIGTRDTRHLLDDTSVEVMELREFVAASRASRIEFQARETFLLCSRDLRATVIPERRAEVEQVCEGYETMDAALATERARQERLSS